MSATSLLGRRNEWRVVEKLPLDTRCKYALLPGIDAEFPVAAGAAGLSTGIILIPQYLRSSAELKHTTLVEIDKGQTRMRIADEVAERIEHVIAGEIRDTESAWVKYLNESRSPAAV